jgi:hypothetical protein
MKNYIKYTFAIAFAALVLSSCEEVADNPIPHIASPVLLETATLDTDETTAEIMATFYELDKTGIMDNTVGIDSIPLANLSVQVFAGTASLGTFTTDNAGSFTVTYDPSTITDKLEWAGIYNNVAFRFIR